jgi:sigma-B regulation protein RsbU (phosphoserine phosphatase)
MTVEEIKALFAARVTAFAARDVPALVASYAEDCVVESPTSGTWVGRAAVEQRYRKMFAAVPDLTMELVDLVATGDQVVVIGTVSGTDSRGKQFKFSNVVLITLKDGQIVRQRYVNDVLLQRVEQELETAAEIQQALLPPGQYIGAGFEVAAASRPCRAIGGDFFDYFDLPGQAFGFVLGDVSGKGPPAALLSAALQGILGVHAQSGVGSAEALTRANRSLLRRAIPGRFATVLYGSLSCDGWLTYTNAGHNPPFLIGRHGRRRLQRGGLVMGIFDEATFDEETLQLQPDDLVVVFSDGVTEALSRDGTEFGEDRLLSCLEAHRALAPAALVQCILDTVHRFSAGVVQSDDVTVLVLRYAGEPTVAANPRDS